MYRLVFVVLCILATPVLAVVEVKTPLTHHVRTGSAAAAVGTVTRRQDNMLFVKITDTIRGTAIPATLRIQLPAENAATQPESEQPRADVGAPVAVFFSNRAGTAIVHVEDRWQIGNYTSPAALPLRGEHAELRGTYPGRTAELIELLQAIKKGESPLLDKLTTPPFAGNFREVAKLPGVRNPVWVAAGETATGHAAEQVLLVGMADSVYRFTVPRQGAVRQGSKPLQVSGKYGFVGAFGVGVAQTYFVPGRQFELFPQEPPLALWSIAKGKDETIHWLTRDGKGWAQARRDAKAESKPLFKPAADAPVAAALGTFGPHSDLCALLAGRDGLLRISWSDPKRVDDDERLTGSKITQYVAHHRAHGLQDVQLVTLDANGDGKPDIFIRAAGGNLLLINRGYGAYLVVPNAAPALDAAKKGLLTTLALTPAGSSLVLLAEDGTLRALDPGP